MPPAGIPGRHPCQHDKRFPLLIPGLRATLPVHLNRKLLWDHDAGTFEHLEDVHPQARMSGERQGIAPRE